MTVEPSEEEKKVMTSDEVPASADRSDHVGPCPVRGVQNPSEPQSDLVERIESYIGLRYELMATVIAPIFCATFPAYFAFMLGRHHGFDDLLLLIFAVFVSFVIGRAFAVGALHAVAANMLLSKRLRKRVEQARKG
jgi:hypothetical protein